MIVCAFRGRTNAADTRYRIDCGAPVAAAAARAVPAPGVSPCPMTTPAMTIGRGLPDPCLTNRDTGDWTFPYDQTMSGRHAEIREEEGQFVLHDLGSRNGIAVAVRGDRQVKPGQRVLVGDQVLRLESA